MDYTEMIIDLQDKNAKLRLGLGKLLEICDNTKQKEVSELWHFRIGLAKQMLHETDPNKK